MNLQVTEYDLEIITNALTERLEKVNQSLEKTHERIKDIKESVENARAFKTMYPSMLESRLEKLDLAQYKRDIIMEEVYQLEKLLHEVSVTKE